MILCKNFTFLRIARCCARKLGDFAPKATSVGIKAAGQYTLEPLTNRVLIRVRGMDVVPFLQGLVCNDVTPLQQPEGPASIYALFLNKGGRVMYDTIIYRTNDADTFLLECDGDASAEFRRNLRMFRVRKRIDIDTVENQIAPWVLFTEHRGGALNAIKMEPEFLVSPDPRLTTLGTRILAPVNMHNLELAKQFSRDNDIATTSATTDSNYQLLRYKQGVAEGVIELPPGKCFPLEANADFLNGVSFNKGCYIGQELTARVHHSGVIRKRYMPIRLTAPLGSNLTVQSLAGANLGRIFGHANGRGVALLRIEQVLDKQQELVVDGERCYAEKPLWWPNDVSSKRRSMAMLE